MGESLKRKRAKAHVVRCEKQLEEFKQLTLLHGHAEECGTFYTCKITRDEMDCKIGDQLVLYTSLTDCDVVIGNVCVAKMCPQDAQSLRSRCGEAFHDGTQFPVVVRERNDFTGHLRVSFP